LIARLTGLRLPCSTINSSTRSSSVQSSDTPTHALEINAVQTVEVLDTRQLDDEPDLVACIGGLVAAVDSPAAQDQTDPLSSPMTTSVSQFSMLSLSSPQPMPVYGSEGVLSGDGACFLPNNERKPIEGDCESECVEATEATPSGADLYHRLCRDQMHPQEPQKGVGCVGQPRQLARGDLL
jgi:hypothetical protein